MNFFAKIATLIFLILTLFLARKKDNKIPLQPPGSSQQNKEIFLNVLGWTGDTAKKYSFTTFTVPSGYSVYNILSVYKKSPGNTWIETDSLSSRSFYRIENNKVIIHSYWPYPGLFWGLIGER